MLCLSMTISCCSVLTEVGDIEADNRTLSNTVAVRKSAGMGTVTSDICHTHPYTPLHLATRPL